MTYLAAGILLVPSIALIWWAVKQERKRNWRGDGK